MISRTGLVYAHRDTLANFALTVCILFAMFGRSISVHKIYDCSAGAFQ